ncbi:MAG: hypothetical protein JW384_00465 [Nitrosomonadaceae bacterium]|nr:hypothetical protein [Nitrosomonadaceae bacterium]
MTEQFHNQMALMAAEAMYMLWELGHQEDERDLDAMMRRLKDLSAYSLTHAEILDLKEGVEMLAIAMFFGATSNAQLHKNQERLRQLSPETVVYEGNAQSVEQQIKARMKKPATPQEDDLDNPAQPRLF